jgi:hypothetical protein
MRTIASIVTILAFALNGFAQTWKPSYDYDKNIYGFEDVYGNKKEMKYKSAILLDEDNPQYTIVTVAKNENEELYGIVENNSLKVVVPITHKYISVTDKVVHLEDEREYGSSHEFYTTDLKRIYPDSIIGDGFDVDTKNGFITLKDKEEKRGVIDKTGKIIIPFSADNARIYILDGGYFAIECDEKSFSDYNTYIADSLAKIVIPKKHNAYYDRYRNGYFCFFINHDDNSKDYSIIDITGKTILSMPKDQALTLNSVNEPELSNCQLFASIKKDGKDYLYGCYSKTGELVVPFYNDIHLLTCGLFTVGSGKDWDTRKKGVYDTETKKIIIPITYWSIDFVKSENKIKAYPTKSDYKTFDLFDLKGNKLKK